LIADLAPSSCIESFRLETALSWLSALLMAFDDFETPLDDLEVPVELPDGK
jgi:hypothetical protein